MELKTQGFGVFRRCQLADMHRCNPGIFIWATLCDQCRPPKPLSDLRLGALLLLKNSVKSAPGMRLKLVPSVERDGALMARVHLKVECPTTQFCGTLNHFCDQ